MTYILAVLAFPILAVVVAFGGYYALKYFASLARMETPQ